MITRLRRLFARNRRRFVWTALAVLLVPVTAVNLAADSPFLGALALNLYTELLGAVLIVQFGLEYLLRRRDVELLPSLPKQDLIADCGTARKQVEIYETFSMLPTDYDGTAAAFERAVTGALANGAVVRVLILAPNSAGLAERDGEIGRMLPVDDLAAQNFRSFHRLLHALSTGPIDGRARTGNLLVRLIEEKPPSTMYIVDDLLYHAPFPRAGRADVSQNLRIKISGTGSIGHHYRETFLEEWERWEEPAALESRTMAQLVDVLGNDYPVYALFDWRTGRLTVAWLEVFDRRTGLDYRALVGRFRTSEPATVRLFGAPQEWRLRLTWVEERDHDADFDEARRGLHRRYGVMPEGVGNVRVLQGTLPGYVATLQPEDGTPVPVYLVEHEGRRYVSWYGPGDHWLDCAKLPFPDRDALSRRPVLLLGVDGAPAVRCRLLDVAGTGADRYLRDRLFVDRYGFSFFTAAAIYEVVAVAEA